MVSSEIVGLIGILLLIVLIFARMWVGLAMTLVGFCGFAYLKGINAAFVISGTIPYTTIAYYPLTAIPLFLLMGVVILNARLGEDLYETTYKWVGHLRGGLALATVLACVVFAAITGASTPSLIAMGKIALPQMRKFKYEDSLATGSIACAGTLAILIPPSMAFILYGVVTGQSVGLLFMAGILPGVLLTAFFVGAIFITTILRPEAGPAGTKTSFKAKVISLKNVWHLVLLVLLILGGIYGGIFTPTEAGAIGAFGVIVIAAASRRLTLRIILDSFLETGRATAMVFLLIIGAYFFMRFIAVSQVTVVLSEVVSQAALPPLVIFGLIVLLYIILGMFLDIIGAILITIPVIYPLIIALGFDPIWFGVIAVMVIQMGLVTPPVGFEVYILSGVTNVPVSTIFRGVAPFCIAIIICIIILVIFPQIALFLPGTMMR